MESSDTAALQLRSCFNFEEKKKERKSFLYVQNEINRFCSSLLVPITVQFISLREHELTKCNNWCMLLSRFLYEQPWFIVTYSSAHHYELIKGKMDE